MSGVGGVGSAGGASGAGAAGVSAPSQGSGCGSETPGTGSAGDSSQVSNATQSTKEIRKTLTYLGGNNKTILINEDMTIILNEFKIAKNEYGNLFLKSNGKMIWVMGAMKLDIMLNLFVTENSDKAYLFMSACYVNCSKFNSKFDKMIKPINSTNTKVQKTTINTSDDGSLTEQLQVLTELYKSGTLSKEEFEKAKKKILD